MHVHVYAYVHSGRHAVSGRLAAFRSRTCVGGGRKRELFGHGLGDGTQGTRAGGQAGRAELVTS